jgi:hypothetical protein
MHYLFFHLTYIVTYCTVYYIETKKKLQQIKICKLLKYSFQIIIHYFHKGQNDVTEFCIVMNRGAIGPVWTGF